MKRRSLTKDEIRWAYEKWCDHRTYMEIAMALGVHEKTVKRALDGKERILTVLVYPEGGNNEQN